jgi:hypothetical protein
MVAVAAETALAIERGHSTGLGLDRFDVLTC